MSIRIKDVHDMAKDVLDLTDNGWERTIYYDLSKLLEEAGETAECLTKQNPYPGKKECRLEDLGDELSDVLIICFVIAEKKGINLEEAIARKQTKRIKKLLDKFHGGNYPEGFTPRVK